MPIYEYECQDCGYEFDALQKITEDPLTDCPECGGKVKRLISRSTFILKGSGWYATDYGSKGSGGGNGRSKDIESAKEKDSSSTEKKTDSSSKSDSSGKSSDAPASNK